PLAAIGHDVIGHLAARGFDAALRLPGFGLDFARHLGGHELAGWKLVQRLPDDRNRLSALEHPNVETVEAVAHHAAPVSTRIRLPERDLEIEIWIRPVRMRFSKVELNARGRKFGAPQPVVDRHPKGNARQPGESLDEDLIE